jgi:hypothetical protein
MASRVVTSAVKEGDKSHRSPPHDERGDSDYLM